MKLKNSRDRVSVHITPLDPLTAMDELALWQVALAAQRQEFEEAELELQEFACTAITVHGIGAQNSDITDASILYAP